MISLSKLKKLTIEKFFYFNLVPRVFFGLARDEDPGEIGNNSQPDWSTFKIAFSTSGI